MKIQEFDHSIDVTRSLIWRHNQAENLQALINNKKSALDELNQGFWNDWYTDVFNLQTANEFGLSLWSIILDIPLSVEPADPAPPNTNFGFGPFRKNFGNGNFTPSESEIVLSKEDARRVLKLRYYQLITRATIPECNKISCDVFCDLGASYVQDNQDMTMTYFLGFPDDAQIRFILDNYDLLPRPSGVGIDYFFYADSFKSTWKTDNAGVSASNQIQLPLVAGAPYNFEVNWGDGSTDIITSGTQPETLHTYESSGTYEVVITGLCDGWRFNNGGDKDKIIGISRWGKDFKLGNGTGYFYGCSNLVITATDTLNTSEMTTMQNAFRDCDSIVDIPNIGTWDTSGVSSWFAAFGSMASFTGSSLSDLDVSGDTSFTSMFFNSPLFNADISGWIVSNATSFNTMFLNATSFDRDLGAWTPTSLTSATRMLFNVTLSTANYDSLLIGWEGQALQNNVTFDGGNSKYSAGAAATARANIISTYSWVITDGGPA